MSVSFKKASSGGIYALCCLFLAGLIWSGAAAAEQNGRKVSITHVRLLFNNGKSVYTVEPGGTVQAYAVVKYRGAGFFEAQWKVNGRLMSRVQKQLDGSRSVTVVTPRVPDLPTEQLGSYRLEFSIITPAGYSEELVLVYHIMVQGK